MVKMSNKSTNTNLFDLESKLNSGNKSISLDKMDSAYKYFENNFSDYYDLILLELSDGALTTEDGCSFPIHKCMLAKTSKYFSVLFCSRDNGKEDILIPGIKGEDLSNILCYLYTGSIRVTYENIFDLIVASDYLLLDNLLFELKQHLRSKLTVINSLPIFQVSQEINQNDISRESFRFIQLHFESIVSCQDSQISELPLDILNLLLRDKSLRITSENIVWLAIIKWVEADTHNRLPLVPDLLKHLAIFDIDENTANEILQHDIVAKNPSCHEMFHMESRIAQDSLTTLQNYFQTYTCPMAALSEHRQPSKLNVITQFRRCNDATCIQAYLTFDDNMDLWRKILEFTDLREGSIENTELLLINNCIYIFELEEGRILCYNIVEKQWNNLVGLTRRYEYNVVQLDGILYVLGGYSHELETTPIMDVGVYDSNSGEWSLKTPLLPVDEPIAVTHNKIIYVLGLNPNSRDRIIAQAYDPSSDTWSPLPSPPTTRSHFRMVVYRNMIYVFGGLFNFSACKDVEVFDPNKNEWSTEVNLPYIYNDPTAVILNDKLIVYNNLYDDVCHVSAYPPVQWNDQQKLWEILETSWLKKMYNFRFLTTENSECINILSRESKNPATHFEYSPFSK